MVLFHSMTQATLYIAITAFFILSVTLRKSPFTTAGVFVQEIFTSRKYLLHFVAMIAILFFNKIELIIENNLKHHVDFTPIIYKLEGNFVANVQHWFQHPLLTDVLAFFYVAVFPALLISSIAIYTHQRNHRMFYALTYAVIINYTIAIPFYLFFPVAEVWSFHPDVKFLMLDAFPTFETEYRPLSGLDNCFPSLHTSISVTLALIAVRSNNKVWKWMVCISAFIIIFTIFYMGIHWLSDMIGGILLAIVATQVGIRISEEKSIANELVLPQQWKSRNTGE